MYRNFDNIYVVIVIFSEFKVHLTLIENYVYVELLNKLIIYPGLSRLNLKRNGEKRTKRTRSTISKVIIKFFHVRLINNKVYQHINSLSKSLSRWHVRFASLSLSLLFSQWLSFRKTGHGVYQLVQNGVTRN